MKRGRETFDALSSSNSTTHHPEDLLPQPNSLCARCETKKRMSKTSSFCSDECAFVYNRSCVFCRKVRVKKKYCSDLCRQSNVKRMGSGRELYPVCEKYLRGVCPFPRKRCWKRHPRIEPREGNIVVQYEKVHSSRVKRYIKSRYGEITTQHSEVVGLRDGLSRKRDCQSRFLFMSCEKQDEFLRDLQDDLVLCRVARRCYLVSKHFANLDSVCKFVREEGKIISRIQVFPNVLESRLAHEDFFHPKKGKYVLFVLRVRDTFHVGIESNDIPRPVLECNTPPEAVSRAYYKLREIFVRSNYVMQWARDVSSSNICALDVGASPGGWSYLLSTKCDMVYAVDPAEMASPIPKNVIHYREKIENVVLKEKIKSKSIHLYVCDMNANPNVMVNVFKSAISLLVDRAAVVLTFKSFQDAKRGGHFNNTQAKEDTKYLDDEEAALDLLRGPMRVKMQALLRILDRDFAIPNTLRTFHLMSNGVQERTVIFRFGRRSVLS